MPYLQIKSPEGRKLKKLPDGSTTIGRSSQNTIKISDEQASRQHCTIEKTEGGWQVRDMGSRNGTKMNGDRFDVQPLRSGDVFEIGQTQFSFFVDDPRNAPKAAPPPAAPVAPVAVAATAGGAPDVPLNMPAPKQDDEQDEDDDQADVPAYEAPKHPRFISGDAIAALHQLVAPHRSQVHFPAEKIGLVNARGITVHAADLAGEEGEQHEIGESIHMLRMLLWAAFATRASDLHFEIQQEGMLVRMRVDGSMVSAAKVQGTLGMRLFGAVKVLSDIDIAQRGIVQEGHFSAVVPGRRVDYRVSFTPAMFGQKLVIRVLDPANAPQHMDDLNLPDWMLSEIRKVSRQSSGMVLVCGPTGSGKTTTLYAVLRDIDLHTRNVITIEDPVEYQLPGVTQIPIDEQRGNTFHSLLRSVLRQDPDVILLGEVRDRETAETAMQASMTGHLVLSTIHAKDTIGTIFRLLDLGAEPYLVASALNLVLAQRLVRLLCPKCRAGRKPTPKQAHLMRSSVRDVKQIYFPVGCPVCFDVGYQGRQGLYELLTVTDDLRDAILKDATMTNIREALGRTMFVSLAQMGYRYAAEGLTSTDEIERVTGAG